MRINIQQGKIFSGGRVIVPTEFRRLSDELIEERRAEAERE